MMRFNRCFPRAAAVVLAAVLTCMPASAQTPLLLNSDVPGLPVVALARLPKAPAHAVQDSTCGLASEDLTAGGKDAAGKGWVVISEIDFNGLTVVSFAASSAFGPGGTCDYGDGNVAFYRNDALKALVYSEDTRKGTPALVEKAGDGHLRLFDGSILPQPMADVAFDPHTGALQVGALPTTEAYCDGRATIPVVYGDVLVMARDKMLAAGWKPIDDGKDVQRSVGRTETIAAAGYPEVDDCAGTGLGYCGFNYRFGGAHGVIATATITTVGDAAPGDLLVSHYGVRCSGSAAE